jgi:hypothetical protein
MALSGLIAAGPTFRRVMRLGGRTIGASSRLPRFKLAKSPNAGTGTVAPGQVSSVLVRYAASRASYGHAAEEPDNAPGADANWDARGTTFGSPVLGQGTVSGWLRLSVRACSTW